MNFKELMAMGGLQQIETKEQKAQKLYIKTYKASTYEKRKLEKANRKPKFTWFATDPNGIEHTFNSMKAFCEEHGLIQSAMSLANTGRYKQHKGWTNVIKRVN